MLLIKYLRICSDDLLDSGSNFNRLSIRKTVASIVGMVAKFSLGFGRRVDPDLIARSLSFT